MDLLVSDHDVMEVDALKVGERHFFSNVSAGISPEVMNDTSSAEKKHLGRLAYVMSMIKRSSIFQLQRYTLTLDGRPCSIPRGGGDGFQHHFAREAAPSLWPA